jgi:hypothetical protein
MTDGGELKFTQIESTRGGNISFRAGAGAPGGERIEGVENYDGAFKFELASGQEAMRIEPDGTFLVNGNAVQNDLAVFEAFREWLKTATVSRNGPPAAEAAPAQEQEDSGPVTRP